MAIEDPTNISHLSYNQYPARDLTIPRFGRPIEIKGPSRPVRSIAYSCDGKRVATGMEYKGIRVWDARKTIEVGNSFSLPSSSKASYHNGHVAAMAFSPTDPNMLVSGCKSSSAGSMISIWDLSSPNTPQKTFHISGDVLHITFHPSGTQFAVVCPRNTRDEVFFYWRTGTGDNSQVWELRDDIGMGGALVDIGSEEINSLRFTNTGKKICAVSNDGSLNVWAYPISPRPRPQPQPEIHHESTANESGEKVELRLTVPETSTLATSPPASGLDREGEGEVGRDKEQETEGKSRAGSPSSRSRDGDNDEERERERESEGDRERGREGGEGDVSMTDIEPETLNPEVEPISKAESTDRPSEAPVEDVDVEMSLSEPPPTSEADTSEAITNGSNLLEPTGNGSKLLEPTATSTQEILPTHSQLPTRESSPTLQTPITTTQTQNGSIPNPNSHTNITASPNNLTSSEGETTKRQLRQLTRLRHEIYHSASLLSLSFDPLGRYLVVGGQDALLSLLDMRDWICVRTFDFASAAIRFSAFSSDGEMIAFGGDDPAIYIVSVYAGITLARIPVSGTVNAMCWHPGKNVLAYSTGAKVAPVWYTVSQE